MSTGNQYVDAMGEISFEGNIIPMEWFKHIRLKKSGTADAIAIMLLSEIVYWYRPKIERDEDSGTIVRRTKRFKADLLQKSYRDLANSFGITVREAEKAITRLEQDYGLIQRDCRKSVKTDHGLLGNVLFIKPNIANILAITHPHTPLVPHQVLAPTSPGRTYTEITPEITQEKKKKNIVDVSPQTVSRESLAAEASVAYTPESQRVVSKGGEELMWAEGENLSTPTNTSLPEAVPIIEDATPTEGEVSKGLEALAKDGETRSLPLTNTGYLTPEGLIALYNELTPEKHPKIRQVSPGRVAKARKYLKTFPSIDFWRIVFTNVGYSQFLQGKKNGNGHQTFIANFEWLLSRGKDGTENCVKVAEGRYTDPEFVNRRPVDMPPSDMPLEQPRIAQDDIWGEITILITERPRYAR